jgi:hypothetical protein
VALVSEPVTVLVADLGLDPASVAEEVAVAYPSIGAAMLAREAVASVALDGETQSLHVCRDMAVVEERWHLGQRQVRKVCRECGTDAGWRKARSADGPVAS